MSRNGLQTGQRFPGAGRKKGTPNKATSELKDRINAAVGDWDPVVEMARIARSGLWPVYDPKTNLPLIDPVTGQVVLEMVPQKIRARFQEECASYVHAKRKAVEHSQDPDNPLIGRVGITFIDPKADILEPL